MLSFNPFFSAKEMKLKFSPPPIQVPKKNAEKNDSDGPTLFCYIIFFIFFGGWNEIRLFVFNYHFTRVDEKFNDFVEWILRGGVSVVLKFFFFFFCWGLKFSFFRYI